MTLTAQTTQIRLRGRTDTDAARVISFIERELRVPDGKDVGKPVRLRPWQKKEIRRIYDDDTRRAIISVGRKNGKTALAAMLLLAHLVGPMARPNTELYSTALSRDQAAVLFLLAAKMVRLASRLRSRVLIRETIKQLYCPSLGTSYVALSADASTAMGKSPVFLVHDELGQVQGPRHRLYDAMETATSAHERPLSVIISTQAPSDNDLLSILIDDALTGADPRTKVGLYTAPDDEDPFSVQTIKKANPAFGDFQNRKEILDMAQAAKRMPAREAEYRNLILTQRIEIANPFVSKSVWKDNGGTPGPLHDIYGGLDLSEVNDLTALVLVSPHKGKFDVDCTFWLPEEGLIERARRDRVAYDLWAEQGHLKTTPGRSIEYSYVAERLVSMIRTHKVRKIAFDRYNMRHLRPWLIRAGMTEAEIDATFFDFGQGWVSMAPALRTLEGALLNKRVRHGMHPILTWNAGNAVVKMDPSGNRKLDKSKSRGRIDGMVALAMAMAVADTTSHEKHVFDGVDLTRILVDA
jgi:phage terminase large subunit-like protein